MKLNKNLSVGFVLVVAIGTANIALAETDAQLLKESKVTRAQAQQTALANVPNGKITSGEIERESGKLIWSFDIAKTGTKDITEVQVDAMTGTVASLKTETPREQSAERAADRTGRK